MTGNVILMCVLARIVKKPNMSICRQYRQQRKSQVIHSQCQDQWNYNMFPSRSVQWDNNMCVMASKANLLSLLNQCMKTISVNLQCFLKRTVKKLNLFIYGNWSQKKSSIKQLPKPDVPDQYKRLCSDKNCQSARCYRKSVQWDECVVMTRTVNLPRNLCEIWTWRNLPFLS